MTRSVIRADHVGRLLNDQWRLLLFVHGARRLSFGARRASDSGLHGAHQQEDAEHREMQRLCDAAPFRDRLIMQGAALDHCQLPSFSH